MHEEAPIPVAGPGEVLVRVESASVNFADVVKRNNDPYPLPSPLSFVPGSEVAGVVEALGKSVSTLQHPGLRIAGEWRRPRAAVFALLNLIGLIRSDAIKIQIGHAFRRAKRMARTVSSLNGRPPERSS